MLTEVAEDCWGPTGPTAGIIHHERDWLHVSGGDVVDQSRPQILTSRWSAHANNGAGNV
jgi:hypothetical protein